MLSRRQWHHTYRMKRLIALSVSQDFSLLNAGRDVFHPDQSRHFESPFPYNSKLAKAYHIKAAKINAT